MNTVMLGAQKHRQKLIIALGITVFGIIGSILLFTTHAATSTASIEVGANPTTPAITVTDSTASGGSAVKFGIASGGGSQTNNCAPNPHLCGFPDATNTGVPAGTTLTNSGDITISTPGQVVSGLNITGCVSITASNVTFKNSIVRPTNGCNAAISVSYSGVSGVTIDHVEVSGERALDGDSHSMAGLTGAGYTATFMNIHVAGDGIDVQVNNTVRDCYIHGQWVDSNPGGPPHVDGIQSAGGSNTIIQHNTIDNTGGNDSPILLGADLGSILTATISNNLLIPTSGQPAFRAGHNSGSSYQAKGIQFLNNRISNINSGSYTFSFLPDGTNPIIFTGNVYDADGSVNDNFNSAGDGSRSFYQ